MKTLARGLNRIQLIYQKPFQSLLTPCREPTLVSGRLNVAKGLKRTNGIVGSGRSRHMIGL
jgi:hypothetical protein